MTRFGILTFNPTCGCRTSSDVVFCRPDGRSPAAPFPWVRMAAPLQPVNRAAAPLQPVNRAAAFDGTGVGGEGRA